MSRAPASRRLRSYPNERLDAVIEQPTPLGGTRLFAGYRLGQGKFPTYYGEYETLSGGKLRAGVEIPLWRNRSIDKRRADVAKARLRLDIAGFTLAGEQLELQREAAYHYWDWVAAGRQLAIAEAQYSLAITRHDQLARRAAQGDIPRIEHTENERALLEREAAQVAASSRPPWCSTSPCRPVGRGARPRPPRPRGPRWKPRPG